MRFYLKVFGIAFLCFAVIIGAGAFFLLHGISSTIVKSDDAPAPILKEEKITDEDRKDLSVMTQKSARVNILLTGTDGGRSDTMMVLSYDPIRKLVDIISVPRDTYHRMPGYDSPGMHKLNAAYALKGDLGGANRTRKEIESILHIPIHYYVDVNYAAVKDVVNVLGGVEVDVPKRMKYDDPYCKPPLHIDLMPGKQTLNGDTAIQFLRWRKNNSGYGEGDIQRIERQHQFVKNAIAKAFGIKLPEVIQTSFKYIKTDMPLDRMLYYAGTSLGFSSDNMRSYRLPGTTDTIEGLSYFIHNPKDTATMLLAIYNRTGQETPIKETITSLKQLDPSYVDTETPLPEGVVKTEKPKSTSDEKKSSESTKADKNEKKEPATGTDSTGTDSSTPATDGTQPDASSQSPVVPPDTTDTGNPSDVSVPAPATAPTNVPAAAPVTAPATTTQP